MSRVVVTTICIARTVVLFHRAMENTTTNGAPKEFAPIQLGMLIYPRMTLLDLAGPQVVLGMHSQTHLLWKTLDPVPTDSGVSMVPTNTFANCPKDLDVLFVPGGLGTNDAMQDPEILAFLRECGKTARYVTSVCTGSLILGAAGLLDGYKAATHWATYDTLEALGIEGVHSRVVADRNRFTGGGVTAGIDFGLTLLAELRGETVAKITQLLLEYDPQPPFDAGSPASAGAEITALVVGMLQTPGEGMGDMVETAKKLRGGRRNGATA
jgi:cyclohexyl-isocyanide hydratase